MNKTHTYEMRTEIKDNKLCAIYTRSDGLMATSSWWGIDDGSAEAEADELMRQKEKAQFGKNMNRKLAILIRNLVISAENCDYNSLPAQAYRQQIRILQHQLRIGWDARREVLRQKWELLGDSGTTEAIEKAYRSWKRAQRLTNPYADIIDRQFDFIEPKTSLAVKGAGLAK